MYPKGRIGNRHHDCAGSRWDKFTDEELGVLASHLVESITCQCDSDLLNEIESEICRRVREVI